MFFSKIWFVLLAVVATVAFGMTVVITKPTIRGISKANAVSLDRTQHNVELMMRLEARDWLDAVSGMARDRQLVEVLELATDRKDDPGRLKARARGRLLSLTSGLDPSRRPKLMIVTDAKGKQIGRVGPGEDKYKPGVTGTSQSSRDNQLRCIENDVDRYKDKQSFGDLDRLL